MKRDRRGPGEGKLLTGRVVIFQLRDDAVVMLQQSCLQSTHKHLICLLWHAVVGNLIGQSNKWSNVIGHNFFKQVKGNVA